MQIVFILLASARREAPWVAPTAVAKALQASVTRAVLELRASVVAPSGDVYFNSASLNISGASQFTLLGAPNGTVLYFTPGVGVKIEHSTGIIIRALTIDYDPLPYVFGAVKATTSNSTTVRLDPRSLTFEQLIADYPPHDTWPPITAFDGQSAKRRKGLCAWGRAPAATRIAPREYSLACSGDGVDLGDIVVAATRVGFTLALSYTSRVTVRDVTIHAAGNMAITEFQGGGGNVYANVSLVPRDATRPLASNADGFHSSGMVRGPHLVRVTMRNLLDDYFNVHTTVQLVAEVHAATNSILVGDYQVSS